MTHRTGAEAKRIQQEALHKATTGDRLTNYPAIFEGFTQKGIPESEIQPRVNVFTFNAWKALGRYVKKGEHGVRVITMIETRKTDPTTGEERIDTRPWTTTVFHVSQTEAISN